MFIVERYLPAVPPGELAAAVERDQRAAAGMTAAGTPVRHLSTIYVPSDESCFSLFDAPSAAALRGFGMWPGWWPWPWAWLGGPRQAVRCPPPGKPQPGRTAEPGWRAGAAAPLPPPPTTSGGHRRRRPRRAGLVGRPAGRPPN